MADSRTFNLLNGITAEKLGEHLISWFQMSKNMESNGGPAEGGYFVQARDRDDGWKKVSGMTKAIQVQILKADNSVVVNCGFGNWSDKVGAGVIGWFIFAPLAVTAIVGSVKQKKLPAEIYAEIERFIMMGGNSVIASVGPMLNAGEVICPNCKTKNIKGQNFCKACGQKLSVTCPNCGSAVDNDTKFCPQCGTAVNLSTNCVNCGAELGPGAKFCSVCGTKQE